MPLTPRPVDGPTDLAMGLYERRLRELFLRALFLRCVLAIGLHFFVSEYVFAPDQTAYHAGGLLLAQNWEGTSELLPRGPRAYFYIVGAIYFLVGPQSLVPKLMNALVGALLVRVGADIALKLSGDTAVAVRAAAYLAYFPSLILWSSLNIRDAWTILLIAVICRHAVILGTALSARSVIVYALAVLALVQFRDYLLYPVTLPVVLSFVVRGQKHFVRNMALAALLVAVATYADQSLGSDRKFRSLDFEELSETRYWMSVGAASAFRPVDISTPGKALAFLPVGLTYFLLAPFPWMLGSVRQILAVPETLFFYTLLPSIVAGAAYLLRHKLGISLSVIFVVAALTFGYALGEGNAGTAYRHRAQILPFLLIFAAIGQELRKQARERRAPPRPGLHPIPVPGRGL